jgi:hypothetical protein
MCAAAVDLAQPELSPKQMAQLTLALHEGDALLTALLSAGDSVLGVPGAKAAVQGPDAHARRERRKQEQSDNVRLATTAFAQCACNEDFTSASVACLLNFSVVCVA